MKYFNLNRLFVLASLTLGCAVQESRSPNPQKSFFLQIRRSTNLRAALLKARSTRPLRLSANYQFEEFGAVSPRLSRREVLRVDALPL